MAGKKKETDDGNKKEPIFPIPENETQEEKEAREIAEKMAQKYGTRSVMSHLNRIVNSDDVIPTDIPSLDYVLVIGGLHRGSLYEIYGDPDAGKTSLLYQVSGNFQKRGLRVGFINAEKSYHEEYALVYGMNPKIANIQLPDNTEAAFGMLNDFLDMNFDLICVDSASGMVPADVRSGKRGKDQMYNAHCAQIFSRELHSTVAKICDKRSIVLMTNHTYEPIGDPNAKYKEKPTKAGKELTFLSDVRLEVRQCRNIKSKKTGEVIGNEVTYKNWRNKWGFRNRVSPKVILHWGKGTLMNLDVLRLAMYFDVIENHGSWFECEAIDLRVQGKKSVLAMYEDEGIVNKLKPMVYQEIENRKTMSEEAMEIDLDDLKDKKDDEEGGGE